MLFIDKIVNIGASFIGGLLGGGGSSSGGSSGRSVIQPQRVSFEKYKMGTGRTQVATRRTRAPKAESSSFAGEPEYYYNSVIRDLLYDLDKLKDKR